jgi:hypothetical protein
MSDVQASFQSLLVALLTGWKVPMLMGNDFKHLLLRDEHLVCSLFMIFLLFGVPFFLSYFSIFVCLFVFEFRVIFHLD